jgi:hypothetical protein
MGAKIRVLLVNQIRLLLNVIATALMSPVIEYAQLLDNVETGVGEADDLTPREREILESIA